jgi:hypothetical protein
MKDSGSAAGEFARKQYGATPIIKNANPVKT